MQSPSCQRFNTAQFSGPCLDHNLYNHPCQLSGGVYQEPNYQWIIDPSFATSVEKQRYDARTNHTVAPSPSPPTLPPDYGYRPYEQ